MSLCISVDRLHSLILFCRKARCEVRRCPVCPTAIVPEGCFFAALWLQRSTSSPHWVAQCSSIIFAHAASCHCKPACHDRFSSVSTPPRPAVHCPYSSECRGGRADVQLPCILVSASFLASAEGSGVQTWLVWSSATSAASLRLHSTVLSLGALFALSTAALLSCGPSIVQFSVQSSLVQLARIGSVPRLVNAVAQSILWQ